MGGEASKAVLPWPAEWVPDDMQDPRPSLLSISELDAKAFLATHAPLLELETANWDFESYVECAQAALAMDARLQKLVDRLVPKHASEAEFWRLYYCHLHAALYPPLCITKAVLDAADDATSNAIISGFRADAYFQGLSRKEMEEILQRDSEDDDKLAIGISKAVAKGVIPADPLVEPLRKIDVLGKSADKVAGEIAKALGEAPNSGCVLILQGLSGTGKGTTVAKLQATLPRCVCWSNGNVFRSLTLLAVSHCEQQGIPFSSSALSPELLKQLVGCLTFGKFEDKFDIRIQGYGYDVLASQVANTTLKEPRVGKNIPTVAEMTQGEVIAFAAAAAETMRADGMNVLIEGRAQTLNYVRTPHRFELTLRDPLIIGMRRAAQRMMASTAQALSSNADASPEEVRAALNASLVSMLGLNKKLLDAADDTTSAAVINAFQAHTVFKDFAKAEMEGILQRDAKDDEKLAAGIRNAIAKGVIASDPPVEALCTIDVLGKTADDVAQGIVHQLGDAPKSGCVLILQGLSGTGKGTTVAKLQSALPRAVCWSNGNVFRSLTLLAVTHCEQNSIEFTQEVLTPELLGTLVSCLKFDKFDGKFDIQINGYGYDTLVSQVANTTLKEPRVGKNIPTVAEVTQGEVIKFAAAAAEAMRADGMNVLMEGRAPTLNYVRTPHRFELTLSAPIIIGMRRAAQRMVANVSRSEDGEVLPALEASLVSLAA